MPRRPKRWRRITENHYVNLDECIPFEDRPSELPYLRCVKLKMSRPSDFNLNQGWIQRFDIPNSMMKKIYSNEIYYDDEVEIIEEPRVEEYRREMLNNYLNYRTYPPKNIGLLTNNYMPPLDELIEYLDKVDELEKRDNDKLSSNRDSNLKRRLKTCQAVELNQDNIAICRKHKIQPEEAIARIAITKINDLSREDEENLRGLLLDETYLDSLHKLVELYLKGNIVGD